MYRSLVRAIHESPPELLHDHGIWLPANHLVCRAAKNFNIPLVLHPRGMLEEWALRHNSHKKMIAMALYQRNDLKSVDLFVATSEMEAQSIRRIGLRQPVAIIPNGVELPKIDSKKTFAKKEDGLRILFLSRVHKKKGLLNLIRALSSVALNNATVTIAGPDEGGHLSEVMELASRLRVKKSINYVGHKDGDEKKELFQNSDVCILPSFSENFGIVVAEALAFGMPVITTTGTPWSVLAQEGCGWWVEPSVEGIKSALEDALSKDRAELRRMGEKGREVIKRYNYDEIAIDMCATYRWLLKQGQKPACVITG
jgi:glycosyltransferase involved in cell wall biosynthesis